MADLPKRQLGRTGLQVTMLGYGAMELRGAPRARDISEAQAETILGAVLDAGINYIDTSIDYGLSEVLIRAFPVRKSGAKSSASSGNQCSTLDKGIEHDIAYCAVYLLECLRNQPDSAWARKGRLSSIR